jgi:hypothetical protein
MAVIEAIKTTYLEADGYIQWTSLPSTYEHLQIRGSFQDHNIVNSANNFTLAVAVNNSNGYSQYATHTMYGKGTSETTHGNTGWLQSGYMGAEPDIPSYAGCVIDILDYANTNKKTSITSFSGYIGTVNAVGLFSNVWHTPDGSASTTINGAVDQLLIWSPGGGGLLRGSSFTLYGLNSS